MFDHVGIWVTDRAASERFYKTVLLPLGVEVSYRTNSFTEWQDLALGEAGRSRSVTRRLHIGFAAPSQEQVDAFWQAGIDAGFASDGEPGPRPQYSEHYYGGFLLDPDGNSAEAVVHEGLRRDGVIDHLWIRVKDLAESKAFYEAIAPAAGLQVSQPTPDRVRVGSPRSRGSFSLVPGEPSQGVHMAFPTEDDADVAAFHDAAVHAGYSSNGPPGERPQYHPGYYAAYVLDPDGNNIEIVNHHR